MTAPTCNLPEGVHHNRDLTLQKYLLLQEQHESLRQHLDQLRPLLSPQAVVTTRTSPFGSPTTAYSMSPTEAPPYPPRFPSASRSHGHSQHASPLEARPSYSMNGVCLERMLDESTLHELAVEEAKLFDVNEGIKRALTELLNCDAVRNDRSFRTWVQCRLMDTEKELRVGRRRRSGPGSDY